MRSLTLSILSNGAVQAKFDWSCRYMPRDACFMDSHTMDYETYHSSLFLYMIEFVYQINVKSFSVMKLR